MSGANWSDSKVFLAFERLSNVLKSVQCLIRKIKAEHFVSLKNILIQGR